MKNMQNNIKNNVLLRLVALFAIIFTTHIFPIIQSKSQREMSKRIPKGYMQPKVQLKQVSEQQQKKELEEAFMSDEELEERRKKEAMQRAMQRIIAEKGRRTQIPSLQQPIQPMSEKQKQELEEAFMSDEELKAKSDKYFIYATDHPNDRILVDKEVVKNTSKTLKNIIEDFGGDISAIPVPASTYIIKLAFDILKEYNVLGEKHIKEISLEQLSKEIDINYLSFQELIDIANLFNYLEVPAKAFSLVLNAIEIAIKRNNEKIVELRQLHPDLQKTLMLNSVIDYLEKFIIKKYVKSGKKILVGHPNEDVNTVAFSSDGTKIVSGCEGNQNNLILWDISNPANITHQVLIGHPDSVTSVAFSSDGTKIVSGCKGNQKNLLLWNINDLENPKPLIGHPTWVTSVAFSPNGKKIVSGCWGDQNNLILWDISNPTNITHQVLIDHPDSVYSVAFSSDGTKIVSGCKGNQNNLILWDISNPTNITHQALAGHLEDVYSVAFSPDGTKIVSGCWGNQNNLILWDISNPTNITRQVLIGHPERVNSVAFSFDGTKVVSSCWGNQNSLILWDISNPTNITRQVLVEHSAGGACSVAFSFDGTKIVAGAGAFSYYSAGGIAGAISETTKLATGRYSSLFLYTLFTDQEETLLNNLKKDYYTADQVRLMYIWCLKALKGEKVSLKVDSEEYTIFVTLPEDMQKLLKDLFFSQGFFSRWW